MTSASKGLAWGILLVVVMSIIVAIAAIFIISGQTNFISEAAKAIGKMLTIKTP